MNGKNRKEGLALSQIMRVLNTPEVMDAFRESESLFENPYQSVPKNTITFDVRRIVEIDSGDVDQNLLKLVPPVGYELYLEEYALYSDAQFAAYTEFIPRLNGARQFPFHGLPNASDPKIYPYKLSVGVSNDLSGNALIPGTAKVTADDVFTWNITNTSPVVQVMGVRVRGYLKPADQTTDHRIGG